MSILTRDADALADVSAESALGFADAPNDELRARIDRAFRYTVSWSDAAGSATDAAGTRFSARIDSMQSELTQLYRLIPPDGLFPGRDAVAAYEGASASYAQLYRDLVFSAATLPNPSLIETAAGLGRALLDAPVAAVTSVAENTANAVARALGGTAGALWSNLWPWLLLAGGIGVAYVFRAPLGRLVGKAAA